ncbi:type VII secretion target [Stackebrandtia soli]|uniref:type VII secretion target n=1 Tax=Stackebrandtia soli TaxID=1892856 RepID=UPI0039E77556
MNDIIGLDPAALRTHADNVAKCHAALQESLGASAAISALSDQAYGLLCSWIPPILEGVHSEFDTVVGEASTILADIAETLRGVADDYEATDGANADRLLSASTDLSTATDGLA